MATTFSKKKNNASSTLLSTHVSGSGSITVQAGDQGKFPSTFPFRITVYPEGGNQASGTIFNVSAAASNVFTVTVASDESPVPSDQTFDVTSGTFTVECDWTYASAIEYETAINGAENNIVTINSEITALQAFEATVNAAWVSYTPVWTTSGTAPAIGNGSLTGTKFVLGKNTMFKIVFVPGTTTTFGTGKWIFSLPGTSSGTSPLGTYAITHNSGASTYGGPAVQSSGNTIELWSADGSFIVIDATHPFTWANGDQLFISGSIVTP